MGLGVDGSMELMGDGWCGRVRVQESERIVGAWGTSVGARRGGVRGGGWLEAAVLGGVEVGAESPPGP